jgi:DNA mismatch repair ATPase MutL
MSEAYPTQAMESSFPLDGTMVGSGTNGSGYDFVGYAESKKTMNQQQLKEAIKRMIREMEQDDVNVDAEKKSVTITLDRELAQKLHALLMTQLTPPGEDAEQTPAGPEDANAVVPDEDDTEVTAANMSSDQLPIKAGEESGESVDDVTSDESDSMDEAKKKWIQKAITKPGALKKQMGVAAGKKIASGKLAAAAKKSGKLGQRARLAMTLRKLKENLE